MAEIVPVVSEALEAQVRNLLPSQSGFGQDLQASNVIMPVIDLTPTAEGSILRADLQEAIAFGSQTAFSANGTTDVIANSPGFYRIFGTCTIRSSSGAAVNGTLQMSDGLSTKNIYVFTAPSGSADISMNDQYDITVFLSPGESISAISSGGDCFMDGSSRQIATVTGDLVNPSGFVSQ